MVGGGGRCSVSVGGRNKFPLSSAEGWIFRFHSAVHVAAEFAYKTDCTGFGYDERVLPGCDCIHQNVVLSFPPRWR